MNAPDARRRVKVGLVLAVLAAAAAGGCTAGDANPHLLSPKLVVRAEDDGGVTIYVHSAFGDRVYDRITLSVDNATVATRVDAFSLETSVAKAGFFVVVAAALEEERYRLQARLDVDAESGRAVLVVVDDEGDWGEAETYGLPYERVVERVTG